MRRADHETGFVALLTVVLMGILLSALTLGMVNLEVLQLRKAEDAEQSLRAYYAAEAGVEDAVRKVLDGTITTDQTCASNLTYDSAGAAGWTCQQVSFAGSPAGKLTAPDQVVTIDPGSTTPSYRSVLVEWDQTSTPAATTFYTTPATLPNQAGYNASPFAPPLELTILRYPRTAVTASEICSGAALPPACSILLQNALLTASTTGSGVVSSYGTAAFKTGSPYAANCVPNRTSNLPYYATTTYRCSQLIRNFDPNANYIFRLRSRYEATSYRLTFFVSNAGGGQVVPVSDGMVTIDVTAKAGSSFRRSVTKLPTGSGGGSGLNYVLYSDTNVCKNFQVISDIFPPAGPC